MITNCLVCGKEFYIKPSYIKKGRGKYCSRKCFYKSKAYLEDRRLTLRRPRVELVCEFCGKTFLRLPSVTKTGRQFCSRNCRAKGCIRLGQDNPNWKGGMSIRNNRGHKYIAIYKPNHPRVKKTTNKYIFQHILVMEKKIGRYLKPKEVVHHINCNGLDNRIENLMLFANNGKHLSFEFKQKSLEVAS